jgi:hypothetical protein
MMLQAWSKTNMDVRRWTSLLVAVGGLAVAAIGIAASPVSAFDAVVGPVLQAAVGPIFGAALAGYALHRVSDHERAPLWALAYGASAAVILVATFGFAALIHSTVSGIPDLGDVRVGIIPSGLLIAYVGAFLWKREAEGRRFAALGLLGWCLLGGWVISASNGDWGQRRRTSPSAASVSPSLSWL